MFPLVGAYLQSKLVHTEMCKLREVVCASFEGVINCVRPIECQFPKLVPLLLHLAMRPLEG